jgi:hypothetical protein
VLVEASQSEDRSTPSSDVTLYMTRNLTITSEEAADMLQNPDETKISLAPPKKPKGGDVYLIRSTNLIDLKNDWRCDGYGWISNGVHNFPVDDGDNLKKYYHKLRLPGVKQKNRKKVLGSTLAFMRFGYVLDSNVFLVLVHYLGDETLSKPLCHGNSATTTEEYTRRPPSVIAKNRASKGNGRCKISFTS